MEDENGLELCLGLSSGKSTTAPKATNGSTSDTRTEEFDRGTKIIDDFRNFLQAGTQKQDSGLTSQKTDPVKPEKNFFENLSTPTIDGDGSTNLNSGELWILNKNRSSEADVEKKLDGGSRCINLLDDASLQKKRGRDFETTRASHISINTDEGSTAENEDIADSEADGPTSKLATRRSGSSKDLAGGGLSEVPHEVQWVCGASVIGNGQNRFTISSENEVKARNVSYGIPFSHQSVNMTNTPYALPAKESTPNPIIAPGTSKFSLPGMVHMMATPNSERTANPPLMPANTHLTFGYSPVQLPVLDKDGSQGLQNVGLNLSEATMPVMHKSSDASQYDGKVLEGSSSQTGNNVKQSSIIVGANTSDQARVDERASEVQAIRPGLTGDVKFSGSGSVPDLPWVSTTSSKGRTISGVTYRVGTTQVQIVCACHGSHMTPEEFVAHANEEPQTNQANASGIAFPTSNSAASAQS